VAPAVEETPSVTGSSFEALEADAPSDDAGWALIAAVADQAHDDELFAPEAGQAELSISALSPEERAVLARELVAEMAPGRAREG
jgi:hypothetical protein